MSAVNFRCGYRKWSRLADKCSSTNTVKTASVVRWHWHLPTTQNK